MPTQEQLRDGWMAYVGAIQNARSAIKWHMISDTLRYAVAEDHKKRNPSEYDAVKISIGAAFGVKQ